MKKDKVEKQVEKEEKKAKKAAKKARKAEEKAQKAEEKAKKKAAKKGRKAPKGKKQEGGTPKKSKKKLLIILLLVVLIAAAAVVFLKSRGGGDGGEDKVEEEEVPEPIEAPKEYTLGELNFPALPVMMNEEALVYLEEPVVPETEEPAADETADASAEGAEEEAPAEITAVAYRYEGLKDPRGMITSYANLLSLKDVGFIYVDGSMYETTAPNFEAAEGEAHLVQKAPEEGMIYSVQLQWSKENCVVTVDYREGSIEIPPTPKPVDPMSLSEAYAYFTSLAPSDLGLEGTTMDDYRVYSLDGAVLVDGHPCVHLSVYSVSEGGTNEIAGEYFLTADKAHIYKRDMDGNLIEVGKE